MNPENKTDVVAPVVGNSVAVNVKQPLLKRIPKIFYIVILVLVFSAGTYFLLGLLSKTSDLSKAANTYDSFVENIGKGDFAAAHSYMSDEFKNTLSVAALTEGVKQPPQSDLMGPDIRYRIVEKKAIELDGKNVIRLTVIYSKNNKDTHTLKAVMVEDSKGAWRLNQVLVEPMFSS